MGRWLFTSDLHGHAPYYQALAALATERQPSIVILGGDLGPHGSGEAGVRGQRAFFAGPFRDALAAVRRGAPGARLYLLMGNDDWRANHDLFEAGEPAEWFVLHQRAHDLGPAEGGLFLAGLSYVPITPFSIKDWERWDTAVSAAGVRLDGYRSAPDGSLRPFAFDPADRGETIEQALGDLASLSDPARTVYVFHSPPHGTACDMIAGPRHVGSRATRAFLERHQPPLSLSGHIHESPRLSGRIHDRLGRTLIVQPGQFDAGKQWCAVTFDIADPAGTLEHTVRGPCYAQGDRSPFPRPLAEPQ